MEHKSDENSIKKSKCKRMERLIHYFPDFSSGDIQNIMNSMAEFVQNRYIKNFEEIPKPGEFFKSQVTASLLIMMNMRLLLFYAPGVGKSCVQIASMLRLYSVSDYYSYTYIVTAPALKETMKYQALCKCTKGLMTNGKPNEIFKKRMEITSHFDFIKKIKGLTMEQINREFSDKVVMIDEISKIILSDFTSKKSGKNTDEISYSLETTLATLNRMIVEGKTKEQIINHEKIINNDKKYIQLWRLSHSCPTVKLIGLTGTPIVNHPIEFFILSNIFLQFDQQYDLEKISKNILNIGLEDLMRVGGIVSYLAPAASTAQPVYQGNILDYYHQIGEERIKTSLKLYFSELYDVQAKAMISLGTTLSAKNTNYQIQCFTNLRGEYGSQSYENEEGENEEDENEEIAVDGDLRKAEIRMKCASMFTEIIAKEKELFIKSNGEGAGCAFIYNKLTRAVNTPLKAIAEYYGFKVIKPEKDLELSRKKEDSYCDEGETKIIGLGTGDKPVILFIDGELKNKKLREELISLFSSESNVRGNKIQIIVGSKVLEMGANIGNAERMYRLCSEWSGSIEEQSRFRVFRTGGHKHWSKWMKDHGRNPDPKVDLYYFAPYCRFFHSKKFLGTENYEIIDPTIVRYIVGSFKSGTLNKIKINGKKILGTEIFFFVNGDENPHDFFKENLPEECQFSPEIFKILQEENFSLLICKSGILYEENYDKFQENIESRIAYIYKKDNLNFKTLEIPAIGNERKMIDSDFKVLYLKGNAINSEKLKTTVVCPAFAQYMVMEKKNIISGKILRFVKQVCMDCKFNKERNTLDSIYDFTSSCDYEKCEYECASDIKNSKSKDSFIYENNDIFVDNVNTIFSKSLIDRCKEEIENYLKVEHTVKFSDLYSKLNFDRTIISKTIIEMEGTKVNFLDRFGFQLFACSDNDSLFLRRDSNEKHTNRPHHEDIDTIGGVFSKYSLKLEEKNTDDLIIEKIFELDPSDKNASYNVLNLSNQFKFNSSHVKLLELAMIRYLKHKNVNSIEKVIIDMNNFKIYDLKSKTDGSKIYVNTLKKMKSASSMQGMEHREITEEFRILKAPYVKWEDSSSDDVANYLKELKQKYNDRLNRKFYLYVKPEAMKVKMVKEEYIEEDYSKYYKIESPFILDNGQIVSEYTNSRIIKFIKQNVVVNRYDETIDKLLESTDYSDESIIEILKVLNLDEKDYIYVYKPIDGYIKKYNEDNYLKIVSPYSIISYPSIYKLKETGSTKTRQLSTAEETKLDSIVSFLNDNLKLEKYQNSSEIEKLLDDYNNASVTDKRRIFKTLFEKLNLILRTTVEIKIEEMGKKGRKK